MISWPFSPKPFPKVRGGLPRVTIIILHESFSGRSVIDAAWHLTTFGIGSRWGDGPGAGGLATL